MCNTEISEKQLSEVHETLSKWISTSKDILNMLESTKKSIGEMNVLNESIYPPDKVGSKINKYNSQISTYEIDIKNIADISQWDDNDVKPIKLILSVDISNKNNFEIIDGVLNKYEDPSSLFSIKFSINDMVLLMEDGTFRTDF